MDRLRHRRTVSGRQGVDEGSPRGHVRPLARDAEQRLSRHGSPLGHAFRRSRRRRAVSREGQQDQKPRRTLGLDGEDRGARFRPRARVPDVEALPALSGEERGREGRDDPVEHQAPRRVDAGVRRSPEGRPRDALHRYRQHPRRLRPGLRPRAHREFHHGYRRDPTGYPHGPRVRARQVHG